MARAEAAENRNGGSEKSNNLANAWWTSVKFEGFGDPAEAAKPPANKDFSASKDTLRNIPIADMIAGQHQTIEPNHMNQHPAEKAEGVHHMSVVKWDETTTTKFGYDDNNQLITVTQVYGVHPGPIDRLLDDNKAKERTNDPNAKAGWYEIPHGKEGQTGAKLSETPQHFYSEKDHTYIIHDSYDNRGTHLSLGKPPSIGEFTDDGHFISYDRDGAVLSIRNLQDYPDSPNFGKQNAELVPVYKQDKNGNPIKVNGKKVFDSLEEIDPDSKHVSFWTRDGHSNNFFTIADLKTKWFDANNLPENFLGDKSIPPAPSLDLALKQLQETKAKKALETSAAAGALAETTISIIKDTSPSKPAPPLPNLTVTESQSQTIAKTAELPKPNTTLPNLTVTTTELSSDDTTKAELPNTVSVKLEPKKESEWFEKKDIPENLKLSDSQTGVHIARIQVVHFANSDVIAGYNEKNEQVLLKSQDALYIKPNDSERTALGQPGGKDGWYRKYDDQIRKTRDDNYGICADNSFVTRDRGDSSIGRAYLPNGEIIEGKCNALGALIETNAGGATKSVRRTDHSVLKLGYANENDPASLNSLEEINTNGTKTIWTKVANSANDFESKDALGNTHIRSNVQLANNGNLSYVNENDLAAIRNNPQTTIVRSNGIETKTGTTITKSTFDDQGRFAKIQAGPKTYEISYVNDKDHTISNMGMHTHITRNGEHYFVFDRLTRIGNTNEWKHECYQSKWDGTSGKWGAYQLSQNQQSRNGSWSDLRGSISVDQYGNCSQQLYAI